MTLRCFRNVFCVILLVSGTWSVTASAASPWKLACTDIERVIDGSQITLSCDLELTWLGSDRAADIRALVVDAQGAVLEFDSAALGELAPESTARFPKRFSWTFDFRSQEPPRIEWEIRHRERGKRVHSHRLVQ